MKRILFFLILILSFSLNLDAQKNIDLIIFDAQSKENIEFAHIVFENNNIGLASGLDGKVSLTLPKDYIPLEKIHCSFIGYRDTTIVVNLDTLSSTFKIPLQFNHYRLEEIEVVGIPENLSADVIIKRAIKQIKNNYQNDNTFLSTFYRELSFEDDRCIELNEAVINTLYAPYKKIYKKRV